jgi:hypothetical protein
MTAPVAWASPSLFCLAKVGISYVQGLFWNVSHSPSAITYKAVRFLQILNYIWLKEIISWSISYDYGFLSSYHQAWVGKPLVNTWFKCTTTSPHEYFMETCSTTRPLVSLLTDIPLEALKFRLDLIIVPCARWILGYLNSMSIKLLQESFLHVSRKPLLRFLFCKWIFLTSGRHPMGTEEWHWLLLMAVENEVP